MIDVGRLLRQAREVRNISQQALADQLGLSQSQLSRMERGEQPIDRPLLQLAADCLGDRSLVLAASRFELLEVLGLAGIGTPAPSVLLLDQLQQSLDRLKVSVADPGAALREAAVMADLLRLLALDLGSV